MDLSGFTEQGFKRKLAVQALFGKILYLSEVSSWSFILLLILQFQIFWPWAQILILYFEMNCLGCSQKRKLFDDLLLSAELINECLVWWTILFWLGSSISKSSQNPWVFQIAKNN